ncbi:MAG: phosphopantothenoylcysteine decarboxylase, partial [Duncaniella sp.]|nr:phosphopantothenoylcysteine decarboxylase [Duncaniella sp.]
LSACENDFDSADIAIFCAAVADYAPEQAAEHKIKRGDMPEMTLRLVRNPDIAATLGGRRREGQTLVGFALETDNEMENGRSKLERKHLDMVVVNSMRDAGAGFSGDTNKITVVTAAGDEKSFPLKSKTEVAADIIDCIEDILR